MKNKSLVKAGMEIHMSAPEKALFEQTLKSIQGDYFEFGGGGSTVFASTLDNLTKITSVENDQAWIESVQKQAHKPVDFIYVNIGPIKKWGYPVNKSRADHWPEYSKAIQTYTPKAVLVDGRFRVACICQAILALQEDGIIMVHDFWNRKHYHVVLPFLEVYDKVETLAIFKVKPDLDRTQVEALWQKYQKDYR